MRRMLSCSRRFSSAMSFAIFGSATVSAGSFMAHIFRGDSGIKEDVRRKAHFFSALALALALPGPSVARAEDAPPSIDQPAERRSGVVLGVVGGVGLAGSSGYPNNASLINVPDDYSSSNLMTGSGGTFFLM